MLINCCCQVRSKNNLCNLYIAMRPHWIKNLCILCGCVSGILEAWKSNSFYFRDSFPNCDALRRPSRPWSVTATKEAAHRHLPERVSHLKEWKSAPVSESFSAPKWKWFVDTGCAQNGAGVCTKNCVRWYKVGLKTRAVFRPQKWHLSNWWQLKLGPGNGPRFWRAAELNYVFSHS